MEGRWFGAFAKRLPAVAFSAASCIAVADLPAGADVGSIDWNDAEVRRKAILEMAYAYYLKADCVQYGSVSLVARAGMAFCRRTKEGRPEDATPDSPYYTVCSSFPYEVYYNAIGFKLSGGSDTSVTLILTTRPQKGVTVFDYDRRLDPDGSKYGPEMMRMRGHRLELGPPPSGPSASQGDSFLSFWRGCWSR